MVGDRVKALGRAGVEHIGDVRMVHERERMESFASAMSGFEPALKGAGVAFGFGIVLSRAIDRSVGKAEDDASNGS